MPRYRRRSAGPAPDPGGIVEGKTNHERDVAMGFSVSMIQHVTMRTYQALALNDWKEAAKSELMLSLI